jgi:molybdopterin-guanine dinucleotide biosynthesis protein A
MKPVATQPIEICILAGGLSSRMGRDKSRVRLGQRTLLAHIRAVARQLDLPIRVIRRDAVPRCGPIGGIYTALIRSRAHTLLFLACDMPFISPTYLKQLLKTFGRSAGSAALFSFENNLAGFPCVLHREISHPIVSRQIAKSRFSLQSLAQAMKAKTLRPPRRASKVLLNINTPADLQSARRQTRSLPSSPKKNKNP